jgi:hypothetical protein
LHEQLQLRDCHAIELQITGKDLPQESISRNCGGPDLKLLRNENGQALVVTALCLTALMDGRRTTHPVLSEGHVQNVAVNYKFEAK